MTHASAATYLGLWPRVLDGGDVFQVVGLHDLLDQRGVAHQHRWRDLQGREGNEEMSGGGRGNKAGEHKVRNPFANSRVTLFETTRHPIAAQRTTVESAAVVEVNCVQCTHLEAVVSVLRATVDQRVPPATKKNKGRRGEQRRRRRRRRGAETEKGRNGEKIVW